MIRGDELQFLGGGAYQFARYDRRTGKCLNEPRAEVSSQFQTAFYPYFPQYGKYESLHHTFRDGRTLTYSPSYDGSQPTPLQFLEPAAPDCSLHPDRKGNERPDAAPQRAAARHAVWQTKQPQLYTAFIITPRVLLAGGRDPDEEQRAGPVGPASCPTGRRCGRRAAGGARQGRPGHRSTQTHCRRAGRRPGPLFCRRQRVMRNEILFRT